MPLQRPQTPVENYITEYAAAKAAEVQDNELMQEAIKMRILARIDIALRQRLNGRITADETIVLIMGAQPDTLKKFGITLPPIMIK